MKKKLLALFLFFFSVNLIGQSVVPPSNPGATGVRSGDTIIFTLFQFPGSNNMNDDYSMYDPSLSGKPDSTWDFEGYMIFQLHNYSLTGCQFPAHFYDHMKDTAYAILIDKCDLAIDSAVIAINHNPQNGCAADTMVMGAGQGITHQFKFWKDAYTNQPFIPGHAYGFTFLAYATNPYYSDPGCYPLTSTFLATDNGMMLYCMNWTTGIEETNESFTPLSIFPSPTTDLVSVDLSDVEGIVDITIIDNSGRLVQHSSENGNQIIQIDVKGLSAGSYFVCARNKKSEFHGRFMKAN